MYSLWTARGIWAQARLPYCPVVEGGSTKHPYGLLSRGYIKCNLIVSRLPFPTCTPLHNCGAAAGFNLGAAFFLDKVCCPRRA